MSDQEINIAIAEARGLLGPWTEQVTSCGCDGQWALFNPDEVRLPDYCNDLNAMHEAQKMMNSEQWVAYGKELSRLKVFPMVHATARQHAEAFLRTIGKWEEAK